MSSITVQQAKLDLELVPKDKRLEIGKCNEKPNPRKIQREPTFQVVLDALALTLCYSVFLITTNVPEGQDFDAVPTEEEIMSFLRELGHTGEINSLNDDVVNHMHKPWRTFTALINKSLSGKTTGLDKLRLSREQILWISSEEPTKKSKIVKRSKKKSTKALVGGVVIRETPETPLSKKKEKSLRDFHKTHPSSFGIVTKTTLSAAKIKPFVTNGGTDVKPGVLDMTKEESSESKTESWGNDEYDSNNEQDSRSEGSDEEIDIDDDNTQSDSEKGSDSEHETDENESDSKSDQEENKEEIRYDKEEDEDEFVRTPSNISDDETKIFDKAKGDEDKEMDYTTSKLYDDVDIRLNKPVQADDETVQKEGTAVELTNIQQGNENQEISKVIKDAHVTLFTVPQKTKVSVASFSLSSNLASKYLNFLDISHTNAVLVSPMDVHVHHEVPSK
nr:hypothetical protein [Tanacetum cinerariifolium]